MRLAAFTHALLKQPVAVDLDLLAAWYHSAGTKSTHLLFTGGAVLPVSESVEDVSSAKTSVAPNVGEGAKKP